MSDRTCSIYGCVRPYIARGWCGTHYRRWREHGDPNHGGPVRDLNPAQKFDWIAVAANIADDVCADWPWATDRKGYGVVRKDGSMRSVHSLVCAIVHGPRPAGMEACHSCNRPICASGAHLRWDTRAGNAHDMLAAGTRRHKLSEADVLLIRERYAAGGVTQQALADEFGVNQTNIGFIVRNVRWRHLAY